MLVKGIIQSIDYSTNTGVVRMPIFESAGSDVKAATQNIFSISPGAYNGYIVGDVVIVGFENGKINKPIILGKLYLGADEENKQGRGAVNIQELTVSKNATLPMTTKLLKSNIPDIDSYASINTIKDLIDITKQNTLSIEAIKNNTFSVSEQIIGVWVDSKPLYRRTYIIKDNIPPRTSFGVGTSYPNRQIDLSDLNFDTISVDLSHTLMVGSKYSLNEYNSPGSDFWNTYITIPEKILYYRGHTPDDTINKFVITIEYTKK